MSVIFLLSSLPMPKFGAPPPIGVAEFISACESQLAKADAQACTALVYGGDSAHPFVRAWRDREAVLRNAVVRARSAALGVDASRWVRTTGDCDPSLERRATAAMRASSPAEKERQLDMALWTAVEEMQGSDPLSKNAVFGYAVRLAIAHKWHGLSSKSGAENFEKLTDVPIEL